jgi:hypothetical protein
MVFPVILGGGKRLFKDVSKVARLRLAGSKQAGECSILIYEPAATEGQTAGAAAAQAPASS